MRHELEFNLTDQTLGFRRQWEGDQQNIGFRKQGMELVIRVDREFQFAGVFFRMFLRGYHGHTQSLAVTGERLPDLAKAKDQCCPAAQEDGLLVTIARSPVVPAQGLVHGNQTFGRRQKQGKSQLGGIVIIVVKVVERDSWKVPQDLTGLVRDSRPGDDNCPQIRAGLQPFAGWGGVNKNLEIRRFGDFSPLGDCDIGVKHGFELSELIANAADELAYTAHDLDDGLRSGMITPEQLAGVSLWEVINESIGRRRSDVLDDLARHRLIRRLIGIEVNDLIQSIDQMIRRSGIRTVEDLQKLPYNVVGFSEDMHRRNRELKDFLYQNLYNHYRVVRMAVKAEQTLESLFTTYVKEPSVLPNPYQQSIEEIGLEQTICDYIAGMTDRFAIDEYQKLNDPTVLP